MFEHVLIENTLVQYQQELVHGIVWPGSIKSIDVLAQVMGFIVVLVSLSITPSLLC